MAISLIPTYRVYRLYDNYPYIAILFIESDFVSSLCSFYGVVLQGVRIIKKMNLEYIKCFVAIVIYSIRPKKSLHFVFV